MIQTMNNSKQKDAINIFQSLASDMSDVDHK